MMGLNEGAWLFDDIDDARMERLYGNWAARRRCWRAACAPGYPDPLQRHRFSARVFDAPVTEDVPKIQAPLLLHYAGLDQRINKGWPEYEAALKAHGKEYTAHIYPGVNHGFHNDTTPRYDASAAELAWKRTIEFFDAKLT